MKKPLLFHEKAKFLTTSGKEIVIEMKLSLVTDQIKKEYPEGYKLSWIAFNKDNPQERVLFDNHFGKVPHYHIDNHPSQTLTWISLSHTLSLFHQKTRERFGTFSLKY